MKTLALAIVLSAINTMGFAQRDTPWIAWGWLMGEWVGGGSGAPGQGEGWFSLHEDLDGKVLVRRNHSQYPATKNKPEVVHDDLMIVYGGDAGQPKKAIYFDNEGHVIHYTVSFPGKTIIFTSDKGPGTPIFRLTYVSLDEESISIKFEMSQDGDKFLTYTEGKCRRKK